MHRAVNAPHMCMRRESAERRTPAEAGHGKALTTPKLAHRWEEGGRNGCPGAGLSAGRWRDAAWVPGLTLSRPCGPALDSPRRGNGRQLGSRGERRPGVQQFETFIISTLSDRSSTASCAWLWPPLVAPGPKPWPPVQGIPSPDRVAQQALSQSAQFVGRASHVLCACIGPGRIVRCGRILHPEIPRSRAVDNRRTPAAGAAWQHPQRRHLDTSQAPSASSHIKTRFRRHYTCVS